jgi:hypothetical protein
MRAMTAELLAGSELMWLPVVGLILFVTVFAAVVARVARRGAAPYDEAARLPLEEEDHHE